MSEQLSSEEYQQRIRELESDNKRLEKEILKIREKVLLSEKNRAAFIANMSHAIRTPMNAIIGFSELIGMETVSPTKKKEYTRIINDKGHQLLTLVDDIIEISKIESGKYDVNFTSISIDDFLNEIYLSTLQKKLKAGKDHVDLVLEKQSLEDFGQIITDPGRLQQIINSLLIYLIQSTSKGLIKFGYTIKENKFVEFFVTDSNIVFTKEEQKLLFDYFWHIGDTSNQRIAGNGLGLSIAKISVEMLGGKIWMDSNVIEGTSFYFSLPIERNAKTNKSNALKNKANELNHNKTEQAWKNKVVLVVEDDLINYQFIEALFEKSQVQLIHAENGEQALELTKTINKIDLILMDLKLPEKNGYEITREIKKLKPEIPIIAQTAYALNEVKEKCLNSGCADVVSKPIEIELFLSKISKYLA